MREVKCSKLGSFFKNPAISVEHGFMVGVESKYCPFVSNQKEELPC